LLELPGLEQIYKEYESDTLKIFAINRDDDLAQIQFVRNDLRLTFDLLRGKDASVSSDYHLRGVPTTLIVDRTGRVHYFKEGYKGASDLDKFREKLNELF
jgi:peroxiredoxin